MKPRGCSLTLPSTPGAVGIQQEGLYWVAGGQQVVGAGLWTGRMQCALATAVAPQHPQAALLQWALPCASGAAHSGRPGKSSQLWPPVRPAVLQACLAAAGWPCTLGT